MQKITNRAHRGTLFTVLIFLLSGSAFHRTSLNAGETNPASVVVDSGFAGTWKVGFTTPHQVRIKSEKPLKGFVEIETVDGDGVPVTYRNSAWSFELSAGRTEQTVEILAKHGRSNRPIRIAVKDTDGNTLDQHLLDATERGTTLPATQPWIVGIGTNLQLERVSKRSAKGAMGEFSVSNITAAKQLPSAASGYAGVDLVILSSSNEALNKEITPQQASAIQNWMREGGQLVLTLGEHASSLVSHPEIAELIPGVFVESAKGCDPGPIESLLGSQQQIAPMKCAVLKLDRGNIDVNTVTSTRVKFPILAKWAYGLGSITFFASELDSTELLDWETHPGLVGLLIKDQWEKSEGRRDREIYQAYDDLSGQLHGTLDVFPKLRLGNLGLLVIIAVIFAMIIGPFDYFVVSRYWHRPRWTWLTLLISSLSCMGFVIVLTNAWKPDLPSINFVEVLDVDFQTKTASGHSFAHCYSGRRGSFHILAHHRNPNAGGAASKPQHSSLEWFGQPGRGIGGFDSSVASERGMPGYSFGPNPQSGSIELQGVGIPAAGTKALSASWTESIDIQPGQNSLGTVVGKDDLLEGSFVNPLDVDITNASLYFSGRAYTIPSRIRPGERVIISSSIPKDISRRLQRRAYVGGQEQGTAWNPGDLNNMDRLIELMSFHRSAGGPPYTGLFHRYLSSLECSDLLRLERAVVFAEVVEPFSTWTLQRNTVPLQPSKGLQKTFVRFVLPVQNNSKLKSAVREPTPNPQP